jgi:regulator of RNase E activity RraA
MSPLDPALIATLSGVAVPTISAVLYARGLRSRFLYGVAPANPAGPRMIGPAFTLRCIPVREDLRDAVAAGRAPNLHRQFLGAVPPGAVLVAAVGAAHVSVLGDIIATALHRRGVAGVVMDGGVSDLPIVAGMAFPVFHAGGSAPVPSGAATMVVDHSLPIGVANVAIFPDDVMVGDASGVICIPRAIAAEIAVEAAEKERLEEWILAEINAGAPLEGTYPPDAATKARYKAARGG